MVIEAARLLDELDNTQSGPERLRVLLVEDDADSRDVLAALLRGDGHDVFTASDGAEALTVAAVCRPQVVITDVCMPRMSGVELCQRLRHELPSPPHAILALTALATETWIDPAPASFDEVFAKPIDFNALAARLTAYGKLVQSWR